MSVRLFGKYNFLILSIKAFIVTSEKALEIDKIEQLSTHE